MVALGRGASCGCGALPWPRCVDRSASQAARNGITVIPAPKA